MDKRVEDKVDFPDDFSPMEEESMPEAALHDKLIQYLVEVLQWLFHWQWCAIHRNLAFLFHPESLHPERGPRSGGD
jgi:hypothetical protein